MLKFNFGTEFQKNSYNLLILIRIVLCQIFIKSWHKGGTGGTSELNQVVMKKQGVRPLTGQI
jgi:hypothetical protein